MSTSVTHGEGSPLSRAIGTGDVDALRRLLAEGAKPSDDDISEAQNGEFPEVCKVLITDGFMDVNDDFEQAGDLLINMVWELKVSRVSFLPESGRVWGSIIVLMLPKGRFCQLAARTRRKSQFRPPDGR